MKPFACLKHMLLNVILLLALTSAGPAHSQNQLTAAYTEYTRAQVMDWIDDQSFVVGRWDGSIAVFRVPNASEATPVLLQVRANAADGGVEMVAALDSRTVIFSEGPGAVAMWTKGTTPLFDGYASFAHDPSLGIANSATLAPGSGQGFLVTGHANGFAEVWERRGDSLSPLRTVDLRSSNPIPSPYPLKNIRGLVSWRNGIVLAASEDGDITGFRPTDGSIVFRQRYNPTAQRGINNISLLGDKLLLANCSVGPTDKNLWLYEVSDTGVTLLDALNLVKDPSLSQSFDFDADLFQKAGALRFFASTQEGLLWRGIVDAGKLKIEATGVIDKEGAAILDINDGGGFLGAAAQQVFLFRTD